MDIKAFRDFISATDGKTRVFDVSGLQEFAAPVREIQEIYEDFKSGGDALIKEGDVLKIGVVGQVKAGKSSFLNSLFFDGESVLPKASTPMTAGLTILEYSDRNEFEVEYYTEPEWEEFKRQAEAYAEIEKEVRGNKDNQGAPESFIIKEIKSRTSDVMQSANELVTRCGRMAKSKIGKPAEVVSFNGKRDLQSILNQYVGAEGEYTSVVKMLTLKLNDARLKGVRIVDTPGVNDPIVSRENRTKEFLHSCHGVFFLSYSSRFFDSVDVNFMNSRIGNQGVGTVLMLASKYDDVLQDQGNRFRDDIEGADTSSRNSLEKRFNAQKSELLHPNIDIKFDTTSGISYSLATKSESTWDEMERHIDKRMHELFPSAFGSREESKETYLLLANLELIRDEYLEKMFKANKEKIIGGKISEYFTQNMAELKNHVDELLHDISEKSKLLDSVELKQVYEQQAQQDKLFSDLKGEFSAFIGKFNNSLQAAKDRISESHEDPHVYSLPTGEDLISVKHKGKLWGHNTDTFYVKVIDSQSLKEKLLKMTAEYCKTWKSEWEAHFKKSRDAMFDSFCEAITEFSKGVSDLNFSDKYYRQLMTQLLSEIERHGILKLNDIKSKYDSDFATYCDSQSIKMSDRSYECKYDGVQSRLDSASSELIKISQRMVDNKLVSFSREVKKAVDECIQPTVKALSGLKNEIDNRLKTAGKEYLDNLASQIKHKEETKKRIDSLERQVKELNESLKKES